MGMCAYIYVFQGNSCLSELLGVDLPRVVLVHRPEPLLNLRLFFF